MSEKGKINWKDVESLCYTGLIFGLASVVTYLSSHLGGLNLSDTQYGLAMFVLGLLGKFLQKLASGK